MNESETVKIVEIFDVHEIRDITLNNNKIIVMDNDNQIHIKGVCTIPSLLSNIFRIKLRGDLLYLVTKEAFIMIINTLEMSLVGSYEEIVEEIVQVEFGNRFIHMVSKSMKYYKTPYENIKLENVKDLKKKNLSFEELQIAKLKDLDQKESSPALLVRKIAVSSLNDSLLCLDAFGFLYRNEEELLNVSEDLKYFYATDSKLFLIIRSCLFIYRLKDMTVEGKRELKHFKVGAGPYIVDSNILIDLNSNKEYILPVQVNNLRFIDKRLFFINSFGVLEIIFE